MALPYILSVPQGDYRCPTCRKSLFNMQAYWDEIRLSISIQVFTL